MPPFIVLSLPRSRTAWLSRFLTYGDWFCGHEELRHMRSMDDVHAWFSQPCTGTAETAGAHWWRLIDRVAPGARILVVRRSVKDVLASLLRLPSVSFDAGKLRGVLERLDRKLDQIEARLDNVLSVNFADLDDERVCAKVFEHCLPYKHDHEHWAALAPVNVQINMPALMRYSVAYQNAMDKFAAITKQQILSNMSMRAPVEPDGITFQTETIEEWKQGAQALFKSHCALVGEDPAEWEQKNWPLMEALYDVGAMQIMTARCNGRMFGYLMTLLAPSLTKEGMRSATNTTFYADPAVPGVGAKLQRAAIRALKERGIDELFFEAGQRGSGPRLSVLYKRLGAQEHGQAYRMQLSGV